MVNYDELNYFTTMMENWYTYYRTMYTEEYRLYKMVYGLTAILNKVIHDKKIAKSNTSFMLFKKAIPHDDERMNCISSIVIYNMTHMNEEKLSKLSYSNYVIDKYFDDIQNMFETINDCVKIMNYLYKTYDWIYVEEWRTEYKIMIYVEEFYILHKESIYLFQNAGTYNDLIKGYDKITKMAYKGLMITTYIKFMIEDIIEQSYHCNELDILNISFKLFYPSRYER
jgi:hypothetical protein